MNVKKILVPVDFSSGSEAALDLATSLARDTGATLLLTHVRWLYSPARDIPL